MVFDTTTVNGTVEILASKDFQAIPIKVAAPASGTVVYAGTPLTEDGAATTGSGAIGILLYDVDTAINPNGAAVVIGIVDSTKAQAHSGITYVDALYSALPAVIFRGNIGAQGATCETGDTGATGETGETGETDET